MKNVILVLVALLIGLSSCKKEDETEPQVNKDDLLCREWKVEKEYMDNEEIQSALLKYWIFRKDIEYKRSG